MTAIEDRGDELGAIYHSHTRSEPYPSQTDVNFAAHWPGTRVAHRRPRPATSPRCAASASRTARVAEVELVVDG